MLFLTFLTGYCDLPSAFALKPVILAHRVSDSGYSLTTKQDLAVVKSGVKLL